LDELASREKVEAEWRGGEKYSSARRHFVSGGVETGEVKQ
jgi:hypothetical protein